MVMVMVMVMVMMVMMVMVMVNTLWGWGWTTHLNGWARRGLGSTRSMSAALCTDLKMFRLIFVHLFWNMYGWFGWFLEISCNLLDVSIEKLCNCVQVARSKYWHKQIEFSWSVISTCTICTWFVHCHCYCRNVSIIIVYKWRRDQWMWLSFEMK